MKKRMFYVALLGVALPLVAGSDSSFAQKKQNGMVSHGGSAMSKPLPVALDNLYPPRAQDPVFLLKMHAMSKALTGLISDLIEQDMVNAKVNYEQFRKEFDQTAKLVPEWNSAFSRQPVDQLGKALASGDQGKVMGAVEKVGQVCENCHVNNMTPVQQKYHWPDFRSVGVTDPVMNNQVDYVRLMQDINLGFTGMEVDLEQGQVENARKNFEAFKARFQALKETCIACHDSERKYYVDASVMATIDQLGAAIAGPSINPAKVQQLSMTIGNESCFKCHLVHIPAAQAKAKWGPPL